MKLAGRLKKLSDDFDKQALIKLEKEVITNKLAVRARSGHNKATIGVSPQIEDEIRAWLLEEGFNSITHCPHGWEIQW